MNEQLLSSGGKSGLPDNSDLPFPPGTPFKGIVRSQDFITGTSLATAIGLTAGVAINNDAGWLHYIDTNGLELLIAKKPLRHTVSREQINVAQNNGKKEVTIGGVVYVVQFIRGMKGSNLSIDDTNAGGDWNTYIYPVYSGPDRNQLPVDTPVWGSYTGAMLGIYPGRMDAQPGALSICRELASNNGWACRGMTWTNSSITNVMGLWYMVANTPQSYYGWRPMLVRKDTIPVVVTPFKGEVASADLITYANLASGIGLSSGTPYPDGGWLKFVDNGKTFYIAKKPARTNVTHTALEALGAVHGEKLIDIGGLIYKVRLMTGLTTDPGTTPGGEYDQYLSRVSVNYSGAPENSWGDYDDTALGYTGNTGGGALNLIQEYYSTSGWGTRGYPGWYGVWYQAGDSTHDGYGWRPVLELVGTALADTWVQLATLPEPLNGSSSVVINGKLYVYGGQDAAFAVKGSLYEIDCVTGAVVTKQSSTPRRYHTAVAINGKMVVYGGYTTGTVGDVSIYDPETNTWSSKLAGIASDRHTAIPYNNKAYVFGGNNAGALSQPRIYDPTANTWANYTTNPAQTPLAFQGGSAVQGNFAYVHGGYYNQKKFSKVNLLTGVVTAMADTPFGVYTQMMAQANGGIYMFGGVTDVAGKDQVVMRYEVASNTWRTLGTIPYTIKDLATAASDGTYIYLAGGKGSPTAVWKYTP